jgi:xylan 1,4-beta-xylosidase
MDLKSPQQTLETFEEIHQYIRGSEVAGLPIHISEWNTSYSCIDLLHDTALNAAYIAWVLVHADHLADSLSYWVFSDVFEEADIPRALFHGGFGLVTENGIRKPIFHTFAFANRLKSRMIHLDNYCCVTMDEQGNAAILLFHPCLTEQEETVEVDLRLPLPYAEANVIVHSVDELRGNAYAAWRKLGSPRLPLPKEMEVIRKSQYPAMELESRRTDELGELQLSITLPRNGIQLVEVFPRRDQLAQYQGLRGI